MREKEIRRRRPESIRKQRERESSGMEKEERREGEEKQFNLHVARESRPSRVFLESTVQWKGREDVIFKRGGGGWPILPPSQMENVAVERKREKRSILLSVCDGEDSASELEKKRDIKRERRRNKLNFYNKKKIMQYWFFSELLCNAFKQEKHPSKKRKILCNQPLYFLKFMRAPLLLTTSWF